MNLPALVDFGVVSFNRSNEFFKKGFLHRPIPKKIQCKNQLYSSKRKGQN